MSRLFSLCSNTMLWRVVALASLVYVMPMMHSNYIHAATDEETIQAYIARGKHFYKLNDHASAIQTWGQILSIDPLNEEALELIDDAKFQAEYHIAVLDRLNKDQRLKAAYSEEMNEMALEFEKLLQNAQSEMNKQSEVNGNVLTNREVLESGQDKQEYIREIFDRGVTAYRQGLHQEAFEAWDEILPVLPKKSELIALIQKLKNKKFKSYAQREPAIKSNDVESEQANSPQIITPEPAVEISQTEHTVKPIVMQIIQPESLNQNSNIKEELPEVVSEAVAEQVAEEAEAISDKALSSDIAALMAEHIASRMVLEKPAPELVTRDLQSPQIMQPEPIVEEIIVTPSASISASGETLKGLKLHKKSITFDIS